MLRILGIIFTLILLSGCGVAKQQVSSKPQAAASINPAALVRQGAFGQVLAASPGGARLTLTGKPYFTRTMAGFILWPFYSEVVTPVTSPFGWRVHPILGTRKLHAGVDLGYDYNDPILAAFSGVVVHVGNYSRAGNAVILKHDTGTYTMYGHCNKILVVMGQQVKAGQEIALAGSTGYSTGPHLHLEIWQRGQAVNPLPFIRKSDYKAKNIQAAENAS